MENCLSFEQLRSYSFNLLPEGDRGSLYMHISNCELCACAVNGFSALPFTSDDLVAIHREIDVRTESVVKGPLTFTRALIAALSIGSIVLFYQLANGPSRHLHAGTAAYVHTSDLPAKIEQSQNPNSYEKKTESEKEISAVAKTFKKVVATIANRKFERNISAVESLPPISAHLVADDILATNSAERMDEMLPHFNSQVIYIYDLKVTDYNKLYFSVQERDDGSVFKTHTPVFRENKTSVAADMSPDLAVLPADRVLKEGLRLFNQSQFRKAMSCFEMLLENNPADVNARFYTGMCEFHLGNYDESYAAFQKLLQSDNNVFYPEAEWFSALLTLKKGNRYAAKQMFENIAAGKGFYANRAKEKLGKM